jgi:hypothetical protein
MKAGLLVGIYCGFNLSATDSAYLIHRSIILGIARTIPETDPGSRGMAFVRHMDLYFDETGIDEDARNDIHLKKLFSHSLNNLSRTFP